METDFLGWNILDCAINGNNFKKTFEFIALKFIEAGGKIGKTHLLHANLVDCERLFIDLLETN